MPYIRVKLWAEPPPAFSVLFTILVFIAGLSLLIVIHELGHYLPAKWFGMRVEKFYLFFDWPRKLFSWKRGDTEYGIGMLPLGGYVKISGIIDESMDTEHASQPPQPHEFRSKPVWQRAIVMAGGVTMNVLLGIAIFTYFAWQQGSVRIPVNKLQHGVFVPEGTVGYDLGFRTGDKLVSYNGQPVLYLPDTPELQSTLMESGAYYEVERDGKPLRINIPNDYLNRLTERRKTEGRLDAILFLPNLPAVVRLDSTTLDAPGPKAGIQTGDRIAAIDSQPVTSFYSMRPLLQERKSKLVQLTVVRNGETLNLTAQLDTNAMLGVAALEQPPVERTDYNILTALGPGSAMAFRTVTDQIAGFGKIFRGEVEAGKNVAGPIRIAKVLGDSAREGFDRWLQVVGILSMVLAFVNILPIPALDGGHLVFLLIEAVTRREPSLKVRLVAQQVGMLLLFCLMGYVLFNDAVNSFFS